ncbi:M56 family metallopeptidase [Brevundimonas sp.]|uniref:M56 family metallopeptidase n=1 Tax=Brevundimonas sp. TaxID=1871086 RepID=UPI002ED88254
MNAELLVELLVKSGVVAGAGLLLSAVLSFRPPADRADILRAAVCMLLGLPLLIAFAPELQIALLPATPVEPAAAPAVVWQGAVTPVEGLSLQGAIPRPSLTGIAAGVWVIGAIIVLGHFLLGVLTLRRWTRSGTPVTDPAWTAPLARFGGRRAPRLIVSSRIEGPLSWGPPPGVVLIGQGCLARPETAGAVLAHELAHIRRGDWLFLALSRLALALFWFNPLVWLLHATLASRTEDAADAAALAAVDRRTYARVLVGLAADFRQSAAIGMAADAQSLTRRITRIMTIRTASRPRPLSMALAIGALVAVATPIAALDITQRPPLPPLPPLPPMAVAAPAAPLPPLPPTSHAISAPAVTPAPPAPPAAPAAQVPPAPPAPPAPPEPPTRRHLSEEERAELHRHRDAARAHATEARAAAAAHRAAAAEARTEARLAVEAAAHARVDHARIRDQVAREMANARVEMRRGAEQMVEGAEEMRQESRRLRDPAYRARQIERARERGDRIPTDAELEALAPRLATQADELEQQAVRLREQAEDLS